MDDITLNLIVLAVLTLLGGLIFFLVRRKQAQNEQELLQLAVKRGWKYESVREPLAWGLRLKSPRWTLEALSRSSGKEAGPGSSDVAMSTIWQADNPGSTLLIGGRTSSAKLGNFGEMMVGQILQLALGAEANGLVEVQAGSETFRQKYMFWAQDATEAGQRLTPGFESALLAWKGQPPLIKRASGKLAIEIQGQRLSKPSEFLNLITLGETLLSNLSH